jgi:predicted small integral membrane protein
MQLLATAGVQDLLSRADAARTVGVVFAVLTAFVAGVALFGTLAAIPATDAALRPLVKGAAAAGLVIIIGVGMGVALKGLSDQTPGSSFRKAHRVLRWVFSLVAFILFLLAFLGTAGEWVLVGAIVSAFVASGFHVWSERFD